MVSFNFVLFIATAVVGALILAGIVRLIVAIFRKGETPAAPPPVPTSLSFLAGLSFFSGLSAIFLVVVSAVLLTIPSMGDLLQFDAEHRDGFTLAAKIVLYVSLLPSVVAVAFALAARGVIAESGGAVRGKPLYRTGVLLAILSGAMVFDARVVNPATWASAGRSVIEGVAEPVEVHRAFLGVETGALDSAACIRVLRVVPGSPADRAGVKAGDLIAKVDGMLVQELPPVGKPGVTSWSLGSTDPYLWSYIGARNVGDRVALEIRRDQKKLTLVAELSESFASLLKLLQAQTFDNERLAVLKAAGIDRRYSGDELSKICGKFDFDEGRLKAIEQALPHLQDPKNAYRVLGALDSSSAKSTVGGWIEERSKDSKPSRDE